MRVCRGVPPCAPESTRTKHVMIKRAHAEERPYRLIVPVVLHFRPLVAYFLPLLGGGNVTPNVTLRPPPPYLKGLVFRVNPCQKMVINRVKRGG